LFLTPILVTAKNDNIMNSLKLYCFVVGLLTLGTNLSGQYGAPDPLSVGTGTDNTVVGSSAGNTVSTGNRNSFFGYNSGSIITGGSNNSFFGALSGNSNKTGNDNCFIGVRSGSFNTEGHSNTFVGVDSGQRNFSGYYISNTTGFNNSFFGVAAGRSNIDGEQNSYFGYRAGMQLDGSNNISIGAHSGPMAVTKVSNRLFIDVETTSDPLIYGEFDNDHIKINGTFEVTAGLSNPSDVKLKNNFTTVNEADILSKLADLKIQQWTYKDRQNEKHIGATAQDFYSVFGLGADDKHISTIDSDGIALAAIKALKKENEELKDVITDLIKRIELLEGE